jgi:hypothetical protein
MRTEASAHRARDHAQDVSDRAVRGAYLLVVEKVEDFGEPWIVGRPRVADRAEPRVESMHAL